MDIQKLSLFAKYIHSKLYLEDTPRFNDEDVTALVQVVKPLVDAYEKLWWKMFWANTRKIIFLLVATALVLLYLYNPYIFKTNLGSVTVIYTERVGQ